MNYYEQIQQAIDYIELNIENRINLRQVANTACMSLASLYRIFFSLTGYTIKEYIRLRRIYLASKLLSDKDKVVIDIALQYGFKTNESFSRAFKKIVGKNPSEYRTDENNFYKFEKIDVVATYFQNQNENLLEKYPDIKVLKEMESIKVACYSVFSESPEEEAISKIEYCAKVNGIKGYRTFGYDISDSNKKIYGYEACIILSESDEINSKNIKIKTLQGGLFAVTCVNVQNIRLAWKNFVNWLEISPYKLGPHQWLEEHIEGINDSFDYKIQLFMPIEKR